MQWPATEAEEKASIPAKQDFGFVLRNVRGAGHTYLKEVPMELVVIEPPTANAARIGSFDF